MERHEINKCLVDIRTAIDTIEEHLTRIMGERRDFNIYLKDKLLRNGVERQLEIVGEAVNRILKTDPTFEITGARKIIATRNYVAHGYDKVDNETIWYIVTRQLSILRVEVEQLLGQVGYRAGKE